MKVIVTAAVASNGVIGYRGKLPWHIPEDLARFQAITWAKPIIMGYNTFKSIGKSLNGRTNIVITKNHNVPKEVKKAKNFKHALILADCADRGLNEVVIIGGASIYDAAFDVVDEFNFTRICKPFKGDVFYPKWSGGPRIPIGNWHVKRDPRITFKPHIGSSFDYFFERYSKV